MAIEDSLQPSDDDESTDTSPSDPNGAKPSRTAHLRPPWKKGQSGNPSGLTKTGLPTKNAPLRRELTDQLLRKRAYKRMVAQWIADAIDGDGDGATRAKARDQILQRLDPIADESGAGRIVLEGITLEVTSQGAALTIGQPAPPPIDVPLLPPSDGSSSSGESFAVEKA